MSINIPNPTELDNQSNVKIHRWVDLDSEEIRMLDDNIDLTKKWYKMLFGDYMFADSLGRLWCRGETSDKWFPYHFENSGKNYGIRVSKKAAN